MNSILKTALAAGTLLAVFFSSLPRGHALEPSDIIVVCNLNMQGSREIAQYYMQRRGLPGGNLLGVRVTTSETMTRSEFDKILLPAVRKGAQKLKADGKDPAVLLIYGVPLRVTDTPGSRSDKAFLNLVDARIEEYGELVRRLSEELDGVTGRSISGQTKTPIPAPDRLRQGAEAFKHGFRYLAEARTNETLKDNFSKIQSLLIRLGGTGPIVKASLGGLAKGTPEDKEHIRRQELFRWDAILRQDIMERSFRGVSPETALETATTQRFLNGLLGELKYWINLGEIYSRGDYTASVDSELALLFVESYQQAGWIPNPYYDRYNRLPFIQRIRDRVVRVGRLDGPTTKQVKRLIDDALTTEKTGLEGIFYIDTRGLDSEEKSAPARYDGRLVNLHDILSKYSSMKVVIDRKPTLFQSGDCPDAALYCGWYSLSNYIDAFSWKPGAVGFHVASGEAATLRGVKSNVWCKRMIEEGITATLGPVQEPYLSSFPLPDHFFPLLMTGDVPLLDVYYRSSPFLSWRQILVGDPLYRPFMKKPAIRLPQGKKPENRQLPEPVPQGQEPDREKGHPSIAP